MVEGFFFFQAEDGIRDATVTGVQTCALPISRRAVLAAEVELAETRDAGGCPHLDVALAPPVDVCPGEPSGVAAEARREPITRGQPGDVLSRQRPSDGAAALQAALADGLALSRDGRIARELGILLADQAERCAIQHPPEGRQLRRDLAPREGEGGVRPPDEALPRPVAERRAAEDEPPQGSSRQLPVPAAMGADRLGEDLVQLPACSLRAGASRRAELVPEARAELDAPGHAGFGGEPQQFGYRRQRAGKPYRAAG